MKTSNQFRKPLRRTAAIILCLSMLGSIGSTAALAVPSEEQTQSGEHQPPVPPEEPVDSAPDPSDSAASNQEENDSAPVPEQSTNSQEEASGSTDLDEGPVPAPDLESSNSQIPDLPPAEPIPQVQKLPVLRSAPAAVDPSQGLCPHHPAHTEDCGYQPACQEIPCDQGCTDQDGDGSIDHVDGCSYTPPFPGSPCTYHCEICNPTPVVITADLPETLSVGESLDLKASASAGPLQDSQGNAIFLTYAIQDSENTPILPAEGIWTPTVPGNYQIVYTAEKTIEGETIVCGTLTKSVQVSEAPIPAVVSQIHLPEISAPLYGQTITPYEASDPAAGWKAAGTWSPMDGSAGETFTEGTWQLTLKLKPLEDFCFSENLKVFSGEDVLPLLEGETTSAALTYEIAKPVLTELFESRTDPDALALSLTALLPEGRSFPDSIFTDLTESQTQDAFLDAFLAGLAHLKGSILSQEEWAPLTSITDPQELKAALQALLVPEDDHHSVEGAPHMGLTFEGQLPEGRMLKAKVIPTSDPAAVFALELQFPDGEGNLLQDSLSQALTVTVTDPRITGPGYQAFYVGPSPDIALFSGQSVASQSQEGSISFTVQNPGVYEIHGEAAILVDLPESAYLKDEIDLAKNLRAEPATLNGQEVRLRIASVTQTGSSFVWDQNSLFVPTSPGHYHIAYEAYLETPEGEQLVSRLFKTLAILPNKPVGDMLDGDYAYISEAGMVADPATTSQKAIRTGSAPWDDNDERGSDSTDLNNSVRSFDIVTYTTYFKSKVREDAPCSAYKEGRLFFEFILPGDKTQTQFEIESMGWLKAKKDVHYEMGETTYEMGLSQVLRGSYIWEPSTDNLSAIGESYQELSVVVRMLNLTEGTQVRPKFTFWLDHNQVPAEYDETGKIPRGEIITDKYMTCPVHGDQEAKTIEPPPVTITSDLRMNVKFVPAHGVLNQGLGEFDFTTGNDLAHNRDPAIGVKSGRLIGYGAIIQIAGKGPGYGLRGCQFPDGDPITFDVHLASSFLSDSGELLDTADYQPLVWSVDTNEWTWTAQDGRSLAAVDNPQVLTIPDSRNPANSGRTCFESGSWSSTLNEAGDTLHITVSDYDYDLTIPIPFPHDDIQYVGENGVYYNPKTIQNYWDIPYACISSGRIFVVQPFYDDENQYIVDKLGSSGTFQVVLNDTSLTASAIDSTGGGRIYLPESDTNDNQSVQTDDRATFTCHLSSPGTISAAVVYTTHENIFYYHPLTEGCSFNGKDWLYRGGELGITGDIYYANAELEHLSVAADHLIKFDDAFLEIETALDTGSTVLYGAKPDGTGWNHQGKLPDEPGYDAEMMAATPDDLIFYSSLSALKAAGKICVAALQEVRHANTERSYECNVRIPAVCKDEQSLDGNVYMVTHTVRVWKRADVEESARTYLNKQDQMLTTEDYQRYVDEAFPTRADVTAAPMQYDDYPAEPFWKSEPENDSSLRHYQKVQYNENGYVGGSAGSHAADSCLVVGYSSSVSKKVAQLSQDTTEKKAFDLDVNQRVADYVIHPEVHRGKAESVTSTTITDSLHLRDLLPKGLSYIPDSSYWGGTYQQVGEGKQGNILNGTQLPDPVIQVRDDGSTVLEWVIPNVEITNAEVTHLPPLFYSCDIGTPGNEETDVKDNQSLLNTVAVFCEREPIREFTRENFNVADYSILVSKNKAVSISKLADQAVVEPGEAMGFTMNVGNNGEGMMEVISMDHLPYDGDPSGSRFDGPCLVTELALLGSELSYWDRLVNDNFRLYYTLNEAHREKSSQDFTPEDFLTEDWIALPLDPATGTVTLPDQPFAPVALAAVGTLPGNATLKAHISLLLPEGKPGDYVANRLTRGDMEAFARSYVVSRTLEGLVFLDQDANGLRSYSEPLHTGVSVQLMVLSQGGSPNDQADYSPYLVDGQPVILSLGQEIDLLRNQVTAYTSGHYRFTNLPEGTYGVLFTGNLSGYAASPPNQGSNDIIDSDAIASYADGKTLTQGFISNILMPAKEQIKTMVFSSRYHDMGLYVPAEFSFTKVAAEQTGTPLKGAEFQLFRNTGGNLQNLLDPENPVGWVLMEEKVSGEDGSVLFTGLIPGDYRLVETKAPVDRVLPEGQWAFTVTLDAVAGLPQAVGDPLPPAFMVSFDGSLKLPNMRPPDIPSSGGRGTFLFGLSGSLLAGGGIVLCSLAGKKKRFSLKSRS